MNYSAADEKTISAHFLSPLYLSMLYHTLLSDGSFICFADAENIVRLFPGDQTYIERNLIYKSQPIKNLSMQKASQLAFSLTAKSSY